MSYSRADLVKIIKPVLVSVSSQIEMMLEDANVQANEISRLVMVGGTTKIPEFKNEILTLLGEGVITHHLEERANDSITFGMVCRLV